MGGRRRIPVVKPALVGLACVLLLAAGSLAATVATASSTPPLPVRALRIVALQATRSLRDPAVRTAYVVETTRRAALDVVSVGENPAHDRAVRATPRVFLIVLRGRFTCVACSVPPGARLPTGRIATLVWSQGRGVTDSGLGDRLPEPLSLLGRGRVIALR
jgi:hypothetical protein